MADRTMPIFVKRMRGLLIALTALVLTLNPIVALAAPPATAAAQTDESDWLIMIYSDADDNILEEDMMIDLQEAETIGSTDRVTIVAQTDRFNGAFTGMDDFTSAKRFMITKDSDLSSIGSTQLEDLGEVNMADGSTLKDFIEWAVTSYPAQKRMLILSDHGAGWPGGWSDPDPGGAGPDNIFLSQYFDDNLWLMELDKALGEVRSDLGLDYFDVIGFDACLMSQLEVYTAIAPHALYSVASEETEPGLGWAYAGFLSKLVADPAMGGDELAGEIVATYIDEDLRLSDPSYVGNLTRAQAAAEIMPDSTLTAVDLGAIAPLNAALDDFAAALKTMNQNSVAEARTYAQSYESVFGDDLPSPYIDLGHFSELIQSRTEDPAVLAAAQQLDAAIQAAVIAEKHGDSKPGSTGIALYFPVRKMYDIEDNLGYATVAARFSEETQWDEFLAFSAGDVPAAAPVRPTSPFAAAMQALVPDIDPELVRVLQDDVAAQIEQGLSAEEIAQSLVDNYQMDQDLAAALLDQGLLSAAPATAFGLPVVQRKPLQVSPIRLSAEVAYTDAPVTVEADVTGDRVGYVYSFIGRFLPEDDIMIIEDKDYLFADEETTVGGVTYPKWPQGTFTASYEWSPTVYAISDGTTSIRTLFSPATYGEEPTYTVDGMYTFADGSPDRYARLYFKNGEMAQVYGFLGANNDGTGAPREITPQSGDEFTVYEQGWNLADDADSENYSGPSGTLTFGDEPFYIEETPAPSGNYMVGIIAEDLDGNLVESYESLFVVGDDGVTEEGFVPLVNEYLGFALLYPETWTPYDGSEETTDPVVLTTADENAQMTISLYAYDDAADATEANLTALDDTLAELQADGGIEKVKAVGDPADYSIGYYDAKMLDFSYSVDGVPYSAEVIAATPTAGTTYVVYFEAPAADAEDLLPDLDAVLYSFDILLSGIDRTAAGAPQPDFADVTFTDDYSDPSSGLYDDSAPQEWGQGSYDAETEQYVYAMNAASGVIYDYYYDLVLPDAFMLEAWAQTAGAVDTAFGLIFQVQDDEHFYAFRLSGDGYFLVEKIDGEKLETLVDWTVADPFDTTEEALNTLAVTGADGVYQLFVNGEQVGEFADDSFGAGSAGYMVENFDETAPAAFVFDDFTVGEPAE